jgi:hypothetical protein
MAKVKSTICHQANCQKPCANQSMTALNPAQSGNSIFDKNSATIVDNSQIEPSLDRSAQDSRLLGHAARLTGQLPQFFCQTAAKKPSV